MTSFRGESSNKIDTIQSYVSGELVSTGRADRNGDIATKDGIFYSSVIDFYDTTVASWRQENGLPPTKAMAHFLHFANNLINKNNIVFMYISLKKCYYLKNVGYIFIHFYI